MNLRARGLADVGPEERGVSVDPFSEISCGLQTHALQQAGTRAQLVGVIDIARLGGGSEDENRNLHQARLRLQPFQNFQAGLLRGVEVYENEPRYGITVAIGVSIDAGKIRLALRSALHYAETYVRRSP